MRDVTLIVNPKIRYGVGDIMPLSMPENRWWMKLYSTIMGRPHPMRIRNVRIVRAYHTEKNVMYEYEDAP